MEKQIPHFVDKYNLNCRFSNSMNGTLMGDFKFNETKHKIEIKGAR
jgi:hypothetical protein